LKNAGFAVFCSKNYNKSNFCVFQKTLIKKRQRGSHMIKQGISGGLINLKSFINRSDYVEIKNSNLRTASSLREAAKDGLQSLYAEVDDVLDKYKDTDVIKIMNELRDEKLLWVRARSIDADTVNANGDYFSKAELLKEVDIITTDSDGKKVRTKGPAYKTFEGVPIYANHKNDDVLEAKGMVIHAEWNDDENCVYCVFYIDESAYPDIARGIRVGYMHDVSMGCQVESGECSECGNIAAHEKDYCECLKKFKGKIHPKTGKKVYEKNMGIKFIELSVVGDGAFDTCEIEEIYDKDDVLSKAIKLEKKASDIHANLMLAATNLPSEAIERRELEESLRQISSASSAAVKIAQTLVGGPLLAQDGAGANATVSNILKYLGIDPSSGLNILDMLNLALNFLEVSIINMFARKDNVDLAHVSKISKSMADLQATMQDLIDEGVDSGSQPKQPLNQDQLQQQQPQAAQPAQVAQQSYSPAGNVGQMMTQNEAFSVLPPEMAQPIGGGAVASKKNSRVIVWSHSGEEVNSRVTTASSKSKTNTTVGKALENLAKALENTVSNRAAGNNNPIKTNTPTRVAGGKSMSIWEKFTQQRRLKQAAKATEKLELEDKSGNKIVISSKGDVEAYHNNKRVAWEPNITDEHLEAISSGNGIEVAAEFLSQFGRAVSASKYSGRSVVSNWDPQIREDVYEEALEPLHKGTYDDVIEDLLGSESAERYKRNNPSGEESQSQLISEHGGDVLADKNLTREELLNDAGLYGRNFVDDDVKEALLEDARKGNPDEVLEDQLAAVHKEHSASSAGNIIKTALSALANAVVASRVTPEEIIETTISLAKQKDFAHLVKLAQLGSKTRTRIASRLDFYNKEVILSPTAAIFNELGKVASSEVSARDLHEVLATVAANTEKITKTVTASALELIKYKNLTSATVVAKASRSELLRAALASHVDNDENVSRDHLKTALMAFAAASEDSLVTPREIIDSVAGFDTDELTARVEFARNEKSVNARLASRARKEFFGNARFASSSDIAENTIGWLADYAMEYEQSSQTISEAALLAIENPKVASNLVGKLIKTAKVTITDERVVTKRISATCEELGLDPKSEDFEAQFRDKAIALLQQSGYTVDPGTFSLNEVNVSADGYVSASVTSRFTKSFDASDSQPAEYPNEEGNEGENLGPIGQAEEIATEGAQEMRAAKRKAILERIAQVAGMGMPGAPAVAPAPTPAPAGAPMGADLAGGGLGALTMADEDSAAAETDTDSLPEPGKKSPPGSVCVSCGSRNVDLADGKGHCNDCQTDMEVKYQITITPSSDTENDKSEAAEEPAPEAPLGGDIGLGAATAPAPAAPGGMGAPAPAATPAAGMTPMAKSAPPVMVRISWKQDPEVFIKAAQADFDPDNEKTLPVGHICPSCGNRKAKKVKSTRFCYSCGEVYIPRIHKSSDKTKVEVSIDKIV
jgi:hypothetical protein